MGICFFFAQKYHASMKYVGPIRRELGFRTVFNILGPLTNPGSPAMQLLGVYDEYLVEPLAQVLINLAADKEQKQAYKEDEYIAGFIESQQQNLMGMGRVLVRVSGTEPKIRVMVEGEDMEAIQSSAERIADMIRQRIPGVC